MHSATVVNSRARPYALRRRHTAHECVYTRYVYIYTLNEHRIVNERGKIVCKYLLDS